jgi:SH3 domain protein
MRLNKKDLLPGLMLLMTLGLSTWTQAAETAWISDKLTVPLRSGPSTSHRILHRGLPAGTELTILAEDPDSDFVQIVTSRGLEGWLPSQYLVSQPIARDRLVTAQRKVDELSATVTRLRSELAGLSQGKSEADSSNSAMKKQIATLEQELAEIKRVSANALNLSEQNVELTELNARLRSEVDELVGNITALEDRAQERWLMIGGGLVLLGLICGFAIKSRPRRSAWS